MIEESQFPPVVTPLEVWVGVYQERWGGGELGRVSATDQDPYDSLEFGLAPPTPPRLFTIEPRQGALGAAPGLDTGRYLLNVTVTDGKFVSCASVVVVVQPIWDDMLQHSVSIRYCIPVYYVVYITTVLYFILLIYKQLTIMANR